MHSGMKHPGPPWRALVERMESLLYGGDWIARLAGTLGYHPKVTVVEQRIVVKHGGTVPPLRIGYASDFHAGPTTHPGLLESACDALSQSHPDLLLLGGDFVCMDPARIRDLAPRLGSIPAPLGRYAVLGNHDWWAGADMVARALQDAGIAMLTNRNVRLPAPYDGLFLCGLDDYWAGYPDVGAALAGADGTRLLLMHEPNNLMDLQGEQFALALCGHTHGGQIALPGGVPLVVPHGPLSRKYARGRFDLDQGGVLIVSVGVGCSTVPLRLFADPEVLVCNLEFTS